MFELKGLIFDMDGVIVNTVPLHFKAWKRMFSDYGVDFDFDDYKNKVDGIPRAAGAKAILTELSNEELEAAAYKKQKYFVEYLKLSKINVYDDAISFIDNLEVKTMKLAVASSSKNCRDVLKKSGLSEKFDAIVDGYEFDKGKPDPEIFINAALKLKIDPRECIVFEDAKLGVKAALNGGMACVGIDRVNKPEFLRGANIIVKDFSEVDIKKLKVLIKDTQR